RTSTAWSFPVSAYLPESPRNNMKVNDPPLTDMFLRQRRVQDPVKRRELILDIQRYLAKMVYRAEAYSTVLPVVWDSPLKNYAPNLGYDYGGRLMAAWLTEAPRGCSPPDGSRRGSRLPSARRSRTAGPRAAAGSNKTARRNRGRRRR